MATAKAAQATTASAPRKRTPAKPKAEAAAKPAAKAAAPAPPKKRVAKPKAAAPAVAGKPFDEAAFSEQVARLAYQYWQERGCPEGSPHEDWFRAKERLLSVQG